MTDIVERLNDSLSAGYDSLSAGYSELRKEAAEEITRLRARVEAMERQEPVGTVHAMPGAGAFTMACFDAQDIPVGAMLYALPGAQNVPKAVAYLDIGAGGYMDIGTDLPDEALAALPKGRHMLGVIGTYGVDGYVPAQPAPSVPDGVAEALQRLIENNTVAGLGSSEDALLVARYRRHLLACAPSVPDGYKLVPIVSTNEMDNAGADHCDGYLSTAQAVWDAMLAAAPEAKP